MKLRKYQIDAIVDEAYDRIKKARDSKIKNFKLSKEDNHLISLKEKYDELNNRRDAIQKKMNDLNEQYRNALNSNSSNLWHDKTIVISNITNKSVNKKYNLLSKEEIERKLVIADLGSDFNVENFIEDLLKQYNE